MKAFFKLSAVCVVVFGLGLTVSAYLFHLSLRESARAAVLERARMIISTAAAMRSYTNDRVKPAIVEAGGGVANVRGARFHAETVPAYASTELFGYLRGEADGNFADYFYKEAALNPTNPRDRATDWEADIINEFRAHPATKQLEGERTTATGQAVYIARPLVAGKSCLQCHSTPDAAPQAVIIQYGPANGFGWKENEIIGAQVISVPVAKADATADETFLEFVLSYGVVGLATLLVLILLVYGLVIRPLARAARPGAS